MSRRDYIEPTEGAWVLISNPRDGDVACLRVDRVTDNHWARVAHLSDGSMWAVETGAPLHRRWAGHNLWTADLAMVIDACYRRLDDQPDLDTWAKVLAVLLDAERAKREAATLVHEHTQPFGGPERTHCGRLVSDVTSVFAVYNDGKVDRDPNIEVTCPTCKKYQ